MAVFQSLLKPINEPGLAVMNIKDRNSSDPMFTHLSTVANGMMVFDWLTINARPYKHVDEALGSAQFYGNRVLKEYREK